MPLSFALPIMVVSVCGLGAWWLWLRFCKHVFDKNGVDGLREVGEVARAYRNRRPTLTRRRRRRRAPASTR
jgi:hypothetical protein